MYESINSLKNLFPPQTDFLYALINFLANSLDLKIYFVNLITAFILVTGIYVYTKTKKYFPYLLIYATPYLLFVVGMGYTRQAMAIGFIFWGLYFLEKKRNIFSNISMFFAFLSHKTVAAILFLQLLLKLRPMTLVITLVILLFFGFFYRDYLIFAFNAYILHHMQSKGFWFRYLEASILIIPFLFLYLKDRNKESYLKPFIALYLLIIPLVFITNSTTVADRFFLYTFPLQVYAINSLLGRFDKSFSMLLKISLVGISLLTLIGWFNYAMHRHCWLPYQNILFK
jgi:hypothetical protein